MGYGWGNQVQNVDNPPAAVDPACRLNVRFGGAATIDRTVTLVKVFGCRLAYENRPSTNPRGCVNDLWGFRFLPERDYGGAGAVTGRTGMRRLRLCA
jgi:hypothetical protein